MERHDFMRRISTLPKVDWSIVVTHSILKLTGFACAAIVGTGLNWAAADDKLAVPPPAPEQSVADSMPWHKQVSLDQFLIMRFSVISDHYTSLRPARALPVVLTRGATPVSAAKSGPDGITQIRVTRDGAQSLLAVGPEGMGSVGVFIGSAAGVANPTITEVALVPPSEIQLVSQILSKVTPTEQEVVGPIVSLGGGAGPVDGGIPQFTFNPDGSLTGRCLKSERLVLRGVAGINVAFIRGGQVITEAISNEQGEYVVPAGRLTPGLVSVLAYGQGGYSLFGAEILEADRVSELDAFPDGTVTVALQAEGGAGTVSLSSPQSLSAFQQSLQAQMGAGGGGAPGAAGGGAGAGGGNGSGGGGGGGGGGGSSALGIAGIGFGAAGLGVALSNDQESRPPASPASP